MRRTCRAGRQPLSSAELRTWGAAQSFSTEHPRACVSRETRCAWVLHLVLQVRRSGQRGNWRSRRVLSFLRDRAESVEGAGLRRLRGSVGGWLPSRHGSEFWSGVHCPGLASKTASLRVRGVRVNAHGGRPGGGVPHAPAEALTRSGIARVRLAPRRHRRVSRETGRLYPNDVPPNHPRHSPRPHTCTLAEASTCRVVPCDDPAPDDDEVMFHVKHRLSASSNMVSRDQPRRSAR